MILIHGAKKDLGGFSVYRNLPNVQKRSIGPFVFIDHMGPMEVDAHQKLDVRPHPHIGLATITYLYEGQVFHRDNIGSKQTIRPGDINLMIAGCGIAHSERTPLAQLQAEGIKAMHGLQVWMGLPLADEQCAPEFFHYGKDSIPKIEIAEGILGDVLMGSYGGKESPVKTLSPTLFLNLKCAKNSKHQFKFSDKEIGFLVVSGSARINQETLNSNDLIIFSDIEKVDFEAFEDAVVAIFGGDPFPEPRYLWWNFVATDKALIRAAAERWKNQDMDKIEDETDFIPLPEIPLPQS